MWFSATYWSVKSWRKNANTMMRTEIVKDPGGHEGHDVADVGEALALLGAVHVPKEQGADRDKRGREGDPQRYQTQRYHPRDSIPRE